MRTGAYLSAQKFINAVAGKVQPNPKEGMDDPKVAKLGFGEILCWGMRVLGMGLFALSFGAFALPYAGFGWLETITIFAGGVMLSQQLMNFYQPWYEFVGTAQLLWSKWKNFPSMREWLLDGRKVGA